MEKKMETAIIYRGYIRGHIGVIGLPQQYGHGCSREVLDACRLESQLP